MKPTKEALIRELEKLGCIDNENKTKSELMDKLLAAKAMEIEVKSPHADWW